ncbi:MAG: TIGR00300 family protein [Firmicutes bacterium]|jgi:lysine-ketoglutarate reductase/saccharopine dehydrogenase-like protein (TIGR00300 family)|nr:TIGR00300 family protein [Bacillota bacterium]
MHTTAIELTGHIIDSRILPRVMDAVMDLGGDFKITEVRIGRTKVDTSYARLEITAEDHETLDAIIAAAQELGAAVVDEEEVILAPVEQEGVFPEGFYSSTNLDTFVKWRGRWIPVDNIEMDCAIAVDTERASAMCVPLHKARPGQSIVVGRRGIRVVPLERARHREVFSFMGSQVSSERPKGLIVADVAREMKEARARGGKILVVAGPAVIHTGAGRHLVSLIEAGYVQVFFTGNALAVHDVESVLFGTSLGLYLENGVSAKEGHAHHLRAINTIRRAGGLRKAVESGLLTRGVMHAVITHGVDYVLAGSIRDDGPLPDVITDTTQAQDEMRKCLPGVELALMLSTMLHSIATGNLLPARVRTVCVDINPATVTKLADRGTFQAVGIVSDVEWFLKELLAHLV